ncbi:MAG: carbohydrate kinase [Candidatus Methanofastidiosia archaeon]|jgi:fructokinase
MTDLVCFGELLWDIYPDKKTKKIKKKIGGAPFNVAALASVKGIKTTMITAVGKDEDGQKICAAASKKVVLICQENEHPTGYATVKLDTEKTPTFEIGNNAAFDYIRINETINRVCSQAKFFCFGTLAQRNDVSRKTLQRILGVTLAVKIYDVNYRDGINKWQSICTESIQNADILKVNEEELKLLKTLYKSTRSDNAFISNLIKHYGLQYVFVTKGDKGASLYTEKKILHKSAVKIDVVDTTGCGDAFTAGIVYGFCNNFDDEHILECAVTLAAKIAGLKGAVPDNKEYLAQL